jgi:hypothetical protein
MSRGTIRNPSDAPDYTLSAATALGRVVLEYPFADKAIVSYLITRSRMVPSFV